ncbi:MAG: AraC family transcriptional regulator, partial [Pseudomonadota bacterium]
MNDQNNRLGDELSASRRRDLELVDRIRERVRGAPYSTLTLEHAAAQAGLSTSRMHQVFEAVQRESFGAYVRRARLEYACGLMRAFPRWTCTRVAQEAGFSESSDFSRSFKREYGVAPSRWNRITPLNRLVQASAGQADDDSNADSLPSFPMHGPAESAPVALRTRQPQRLLVLAVPNAYKPENLAAAFDRLQGFLTEQGQIKPDRRFMGLSHDSDLDTRAELMRFELAYPVDEHVKGVSDFLVRELNAARIGVLP